MASNEQVTSHYTTSDIAGRILAALRAEHGPGVAITPDTLAATDHFHVYRAGAGSVGACRRAHH